MFYEADPVTLGAALPPQPIIGHILWFFNACGFLIEMCIAIGMFTWKLERRPHFARRLILCLLLMLSIGCCWSLFVPTNAWTLILRCTVFYLMCYLSLFCCLKLNTRQSLFYLVAGIATQHLCYCAGIIVTLLINPGHLTIGTLSNSLVYPLTLIPCFILSYLVFARPLEGKAPDIAFNARILLLLVGVLLCVNVFACLFDDFVAKVPFPPLAYMMCVLTRLVTCCFLLVLLREILDRNEAEHDSIVLQQLLNQQKSQMIRDKETVDLINIKTHDLKKQLSTFGNHLEADEINDLKNLADVYDSSVRTGNETLDVLLAQKSLICEQRGIQFERLIDGKAIDFMKPSDIYALFGNAMDNAMEALNKIDTSSPRFIRMQVKTEKGMAVIHVSNPYNGEITLNNGLPMTTKDDQRYHGFGLRSMQMVAEHYHGALSVETQNNLFVLNIILSKE